MRQYTVSIFMPKIHLHKAGNSLAFNNCLHIFITFINLPQIIKWGFIPSIHHLRWHGIREGHLVTGSTKQVGFLALTMRVHTERCISTTIIFVFRLKSNWSLVRRLRRNFLFLLFVFPRHGLIRDWKSTQKSNWLWTLLQISARTFLSIFSVSTFYYKQQVKRNQDKSSAALKIREKESRLIYCYTF